MRDWVRVSGPLSPGQGLAPRIPVGHPDSSPTAVSDPQPQPRPAPGLMASAEVRGSGACGVQEPHESGTFARGKERRRAGTYGV